MQLASAGLPRGAGFGIEEMPERSSFGQTPFMENALYVRAVETELARTIGSMQPVETARVHLALPPQSVFLRQKREPSASVMLKLFAGRRLDDEQVQSVVHLVASSVPDLVAVARHGRRPDRRAVDEPRAATRRRASRARSSITASKSRATTRSASRAWSARSSAQTACVRACPPRWISRRSSRRARASIRTCSSSAASKPARTRAAATGSPACRVRSSNQPPEVAAPPAGPAGVTAEATSTSRSQTRNFELDKTVSHTREAVGAIRRLSIGVLVDNRPPATRNGDPIPLTEQEIASVTDIVRQAVGFDEARGDTISVVNSAFQPAAQIAQPAAPAFWENPQLWSIARQVFGAALVLCSRIRAAADDAGADAAAARRAVAGVRRVRGADASDVTAGGRAMALPMGYDDRMAAASSVAGRGTTASRTSRSQLGG